MAKSKANTLANLPNLIGAINGLAPLDGSGKVSSTYLPSYVDDVLEFTNLQAFPATGETSKIYIALDTNKSYRWSGSVYVDITSAGPKGDTGATGPQGPQGPQGNPGATGAQGPQGNAGATGPQGNAGAQGPQGLKGDTGATGAQGPQGLKGDQGDAGPQGNAGATGPQGPQGATGATGAVGINYRGAYDNGAVYVNNDAVSFQGSTYIMLNQNLGTGYDPVGYSSMWGVIALAGAAGATGAAGAAGAKGDTGSTGAAGRGISTILRTSGTGAAGTVDTYTITYTDASTNTFTVTNGANGSGGGGGTAQIQSDWTQTDSLQLDFIKNKPALFDGAYASLSGKPTLFDGAYASLSGKPTLFDGAYTSLSGKPTLGTAAAAAASDFATAASGVPTGGTVGQVLTKSSATDYADAWTTIFSGGLTSIQVVATMPGSPNATTLYIVTG